MATVNQKAVEKDWNARGFSCGVWIDPPGREWRDFVHETDELVMLVEGDQEFEMNPDSAVKTQTRRKARGNLGAVKASDCEVSK